MERVVTGVRALKFPDIRGYVRRKRRPRPLASTISKHLTSRPGFRESQLQAIRDLEEGRAQPLPTIERD